MFHVKHREDYLPEWKPGLLWSECWAVVAQAWLGGGVLRRGPRVSSGGHSDATPCVVLEKAMLLTGALEYKVQV